MQNLILCETYVDTKEDISSDLILQGWYILISRKLKKIHEDNGTSGDIDASGRRNVASSVNHRYCLLLLDYYYY